ncbi:MAG: hypothetical protein NPIRA01_10240 [Nitrospirales bacterium]|nr:MAG: hypothetical protein NPIRA01_10240 [Nitrospirales bacterium]
MDTGYPALITEPHAKTNVPKIQNPRASKDTHEPPTDPTLNSSGDSSAPTPAS